MNPEAPPRAMVIRIIWFALTMSILIYVLLAWLLQQNGSRPPGSLPPAVTQASPAIAAATTALSLALAWLAGRKLSSPSEEGPAHWGRIQTAMIVSGAIAEATAILGLVLFFLGLPFERLLLFAGGALAVQVFNFNRLEGWIGRAQGAS